MALASQTTPTDAEAALGVSGASAVLSRLLPVVILVALMWAVRVVDVVVPADFNENGIVPRRVSGLDGIIWAPLLHVSFGHLIANTVPTSVLGALIAVRDRTRFVVVAALSTFGSGIGVWAVAPSRTVTVGASGLAFGLLGYLVARGLFDRTLVSILIGLGALLFYGGMLFGVLPNRAGVSWQAHLFGLLAGVAAAAMLDRRPDRRRGIATTT